MIESVSVIGSFYGRMPPRPQSPRVPLQVFSYVCVVHIALFFFAYLMTLFIIFSFFRTHTVIFVHVLFSATAAAVHAAVRKPAAASIDVHTSPAPAAASDALEREDSAALDSLHQTDVMLGLELIQSISDER